jgi:hypothetical protein
VVHAGTAFDDTGTVVTSGGRVLAVTAVGLDVADAGQRGGEPEVGGDPLLEPVEPLRGAVEQVEHVLAGAHRPLDAAQRVAREQLLDASEADQHLVGDGGEALAQRGGLCHDVVRAARHHQRLVLRGQPAQADQRRDDPVADQLQGGADLELLDVLGKVPRRHALVDVLVAGERAELLDAGLHVVPGDLLAGRDGGQVDLVDHGPVVLDDPVGHVHAEVALRLQHRDPQLPLQDDLVLR